jgi:hypothetical protein
MHSFLKSCLLCLLSYCDIIRFVCYFSLAPHTELEAKRERERIRAFEESRWEDDPDFDDTARRAKLRALYVCAAASVILIHQTIQYSVPALYASGVGFYIVILALVALSTHRCLCVF